MKGNVFVDNRDREIIQGVFKEQGVDTTREKRVLVFPVCSPSIDTPPRQQISLMESGVQLLRKT